MKYFLRRLELKYYNIYLKVYGEDINYAIFVALTDLLSIKQDTSFRILIRVCLNLIHTCKNSGVNVSSSSFLVVSTTSAKTL